jgi:hypothetical protein
MHFKAFTLKLLGVARPHSNYTLLYEPTMCMYSQSALDVQEYYGRALERELSRGPSHKSCPDYRLLPRDNCRNNDLHNRSSAAAAAAQCKHPQCPGERGREEEAHSLIHIPFFVHILFSPFMRSVAQVIM